MFVCDLNAWARGHAHPGEVAQIVGGGPVPVSVMRQLATDAFVKAALHDGTKVDTMVHYGRRRPALLQSVLDLGDPPAFDGVLCSEAGCDRRFGLQWDHKDPCLNGGPTRKRNLQALCDPHHVDKTDATEGRPLARQPNRSRPSLNHAAESAAMKCSCTAGSQCSLTSTAFETSGSEPLGSQSVEEVGLFAHDLLVERAERHVAADVLPDLVACGASHVVVDEHRGACSLCEQLRLAGAFHGERTTAPPRRRSARR